MPTVPIRGPNGQLYADPAPSPDEQTFQVNNTSAQYYNSPYYQSHRLQVQPIPPRRNGLALALTDFVSPDIAAAIQAAGQISFHAAGDTGAAKVSRSESVSQSLANEAHVADHMASEVQAAGAGGPAFLFLLGDVIYNFGEAQYYYDQFYEPFRAYDRPVFAIPGNHDAMVFGPTSTAPQNVTLAAFQANFCAAAAGRSPDALGLMRTTMTQPGVYFTLDAPFVSIIGLYSNALEGPGVISSQGGRFPITDEQIGFLKSELTRLKPQRLANQRAVVLAVHHPPLSIDAKHGGSQGVQTDIDACCAAAGLYPDMVLSGHAHLYQRFTHRTVTGQQVPYLVAGSGGFAATPPIGTPPPAGTVIGPDTLVVPPIVDFGYLTLTASGTSLSAVFKTAGAAGTVVRDSVSVDLTKGTITSAGAPRSRLARGGARVKKVKRAPKVARRPRKPRKGK